MTSQPNALAHMSDFQFAALDEAKNYRRTLLRDFEPYLRGSVLEVGAGIGQTTSELLQMPGIQKLLSIEPDAAFCAQLRARYPQHHVLQGTISDLQPGTDWNAILSLNVLEHIEMDREELAAYHRLLQPARGALCLFVPARPEIYAPIDKDFGHFRRYTRPELQGKLEKAGFQLIRLHYYNFAGYFGWWVTNCLLKKRSFDVAAVRLFDRAIFPLVHGFESHICPPPIGQSLMAVAVAL
jgi:SAM-dependent methyltransferase